MIPLVVIFVALAARAAWLWRDAGLDPFATPQPTTGTPKPTAPPTAANAPPHTSNPSA